jgi:hypothetical protein
MRITSLDFRFLALLNTEDDYYQSILMNISKNHGSVIEKDEMDSGIEFTLRFTSPKDKFTFIEDMKAA